MEHAVALWRESFHRIFEDGVLRMLRWPRTPVCGDGPPAVTFKGVLPTYTARIRFTPFN